MNLKFVLVTTNKDRKGVFAGLLKSHDGDKVVLLEARNAIYWSSDVRGFLGLAATGPSKQCKISKAVRELELDGVTSISICTDVAKAAWEQEPWA